jgi:hypothetical protein
MPEKSEGSATEIASGLDWPQVRDMFNERLQENQKALQLQREADDQRIMDLEKQLRTEIQAARETSEQHHTYQLRSLETAAEEREKSANQLRNEHQRSADVLSTQLTQRIDAGVQGVERQAQANFDNLRQHIDHNRQQVELLAASQREAISKAEVATERRFEAVDTRLGELLDVRSDFIPREVYEQDRADTRRRSDAMIELIQGQSVRLTQIEAWGGGEKDHAADVKSTLAIAVAVIAVLAATAVGVLSIIAV